MMEYRFSPSPSVAIKPTPYVYVQNAFDDSDLLRLENIAKGIRVEIGKVKDNDYSDDLRKCKIKWIEHGQDTDFLYLKMSKALRYVNGTHFDFNLYGFEEAFQYTIYDDIGSHFDWHTDQHSNPNGAPRKLTAILQLSDENDYEGCDLEVFYNESPYKMPRKKGSLIVFPSYTLHRATAITKGIRKSLVCWVAGERFK